MPGICEVPNEVLTLIATFEHEAPTQPTLPSHRVRAPQLARRRRSIDASTEPILQPPDLAAWARTCHHFYDTILPLLYAFNREIQYSSAVAWAGQHNSIATLERAQEYKLNLNAVQNLYYPGIPKQIFWMKFKAGFIPFHPVQFALLKGHVQTVSWFLDHGLDVNQSLFTLCPCSRVRPYPLCLPPLHVAICGRHPAVIILLIERGATLRYRHQPSLLFIRFVQRAQAFDRSAIHEAAEQGLETIVEYLICNVGLDINSTDHCGNTALYRATRRDDNATVVQKLLDLGAHVDDGTPKWENSPLCKAIVGGNFLVAMVLLESATTANAARRWRTNALLWSILIMSTHAGFNSQGDMISDASTNSQYVDSDADSDLPGPSRIWTSSNAKPDFAWSDQESDTDSTSESTSSSYSSSGSYSNSRSDSDSHSTQDYSSSLHLRHLDPEEPWNLRRKSFMLKLLELGVDLNNYGRPLLTFSQEAWVTQLLLDAGADPNMARRNRPLNKDEFPLGLRMESEYKPHDKKLWTENAKLLLEHGARIDKPCGGPSNSTILVDVLVRSAKRHWRHKLQFLLDHSTSRNVTKTHLDEVLGICFWSRMIGGCRILTKSGAVGRPSNDAIYDMIKDAMITMKKKQSYLPETYHEYSEPHLEKQIDPTHNLHNLAFLLNYGLPAIHLALLLVQAIKLKVFNAAHMLLDHVLGQHRNICQFLEHILILAAGSGSMTLVRRLWSELGSLRDATLALQAAVVNNHRTVVLFFIDEGVNMLHIPSPSILTELRRVPEEDTVLKGKDKCSEEWWEKEQAKKRSKTQVQDILAYLDLSGMTNRPVSALQLAVYTANTAMVRGMLRNLSPQKEDNVSEAINIPCVLAEANEIHNTLATNGFVS